MKFKQTQGRKEPIKEDRILWCKTFNEKDNFEIARIYPSLIIVGFVCMNELRINKEKIKKGKFLSNGIRHYFFLGDAYKEIVDKCIENCKKIEPDFTLAKVKSLAMDVCIKYLLPMKNIGDK